MKKVTLRCSGYKTVGKIVETFRIDGHAMMTVSSRWGLAHLRKTSDGWVEFIRDGFTGGWGEAYDGVEII